MSNFLNLIEEASNKFALAHVKAGLVVSGQECIAHKRQLSDQADGVYGVYAGNNTYNSGKVTTYPQSSVYDQVYTQTDPNTGQPEPPVTGFETIDLTNGIHKPTPIDTDIRYSGKGINLRVLFNNYQWRLINKFDMGYLEEAGYAYTMFNDELREGDILTLNRSDSRQIRFVIIGLEEVGNQTSIFHRFKLANLGD